MNVLLKSTPLSCNEMPKFLCWSVIDKFLTQVNLIILMFLILSLCIGIFIYMKNTSELIGWEDFRLKSFSIVFFILYSNEKVCELTLCKFIIRISHKFFK